MLGVLAVFVVVVSLVGISVVGALRTPGNESFQAKWADWLRDHHAGTFVTMLENWYFDQHQPAAGGQPAGLNAIPAAPGPSPGAGAPKGFAAPKDVPLIVQPALPGEGQWQPTGPLVGGAPAMYIAQFRADTVYTSQIATAVWFDATRMRLRLMPGLREPGGSWQEPAAVQGDALRTIVAAFNGGFRLTEAKGGFYLDGRAAVPLQDGAASLVIEHSGRVSCGNWGRDVSMTPDVEAVLQNLTLIVDGGQVDPAISRNDTHSWGSTLRGQIAVARSGIGVTADGAVVYVAGPALTAEGLADSLRRAGAVRAMTLDLNPEWVTFNLFEHPNPSEPAYVTGTKLFPQMTRPASRYLSADSRDFFTISVP